MFELVDLFVELIDRRVSYVLWFGEPSKMCDLAMSSVYGYKFIARLLSNHLTTLSFNVDNQIMFRWVPFFCLSLWNLKNVAKSFSRRSHITYFFILFLQMNKQYHIQALLRISGRHCGEIFNSNQVYIRRNHFEEWMIPFYDGLADNTGWFFSMFLRAMWFLR